MSAPVYRYTIEKKSDGIYFSVPPEKTSAVTAVASSGCLVLMLLWGGVVIMCGGGIILDNPNASKPFGIFVILLGAGLASLAFKVISKAKRERAVRSTAQTFKITSTAIVTDAASYDYEHIHKISFLIHRGQSLHSKQPLLALHSYLPGLG